MALTTNGLTNGGKTTHYNFQYDDSLSASPSNPAGPEPARTNAVIAACENDFNLMSGWFGNVALDVDTPFPVNVTQNSGGASWGTSGRSLTVTVNPGGGDAAFVRYLMVSEITEQFMRAQGRGWFGTGTEGTEGEALSRFLAAEFLRVNGLGAIPAGFTVSNLWMNSPRPDFVNNRNPTDDNPDAASGCGMLFLYYLAVQLGFNAGAIVGAGATSLNGVYQNLTGDRADPFPRFKRLLDHYFQGTSTIGGTNPDNPFPLFDTARGALLAGGFRTFRELAVMSHEDRRNTMIVELTNRTNQPVGHYQGMDDKTLGGTGALMVFIRMAAIRTDAEMKHMSDDDLRNTMIVEMAASSQTGLPVPVLQGMANLDLVLLGLGKNAAFLRGVLMAGRFRTFRELATMSHDDHRNTLIVELSNRTNQPVPHYQGLSDATLGGTGALMVFMRTSGIRSDADLKKMSDDDMRNTMIVEMAAKNQTGFAGGVLQGLTNMQLVQLGLGWDV